MIIIGLLCGCSGHVLQDMIDEKSTNKSDTKTPPSQNRALQSISPSTTAGDDHEEFRYMQKSTNAWIKNEWEPLTESNTTTLENSKNSTENEGKSADQTQNTDENSSFTLQHFVDKAGLYLENKEKRDAIRTKEPSHAERIDALPGIGTKTGR